MISNPLHQDEKSRFTVLRHFEVLGTSPEPAFDHITTLIAWYFNVPISYIGLIGQDRIIFMSLYGLEKPADTPQANWLLAPSASEDIYCIPNALEDPRTKDNPLVTSEFGLRFYAAAPLRTQDGYSMGILSVIDHKPREMSINEKEFLRQMASMAVDMIESRLIANRLTTLIAFSAIEAPRFASLSADGQLLQVLADNLAQALDVAYVFIGEPGEHGNASPTTVAFYAAGTILGQEQEYYRTTNWPYIPLLQADQKEIYYPSKAQDQFPYEPRMAALRINGYAGLKLTDPALRGFGAIAILDIKPIRDLWLLRSALAAFAGLALGELKRRRTRSVGWSHSETFAGRVHIGFNHSLIGKSKEQQLAWLTDRIIGNSPSIQEARELLRLPIIKQADSVLLMGETGTGKGVSALAIHEGTGARGRFIEVNCAALPRELIESELFGHEKGSFTGAIGRKIGLFEEANDGTIFLDEIAELPPDLQVKLLSVLQSNELRRVGGAQSIPINVRVIAATNRPLKIALNDGTLRHDLFFRIGSWRVELPPLRDREDDIFLLARHFITELKSSKRYCIEGLAPEAESLLKQYDWPGNVRQLLNVIRRATIFESGNVISPETMHHALEGERKLFKSDYQTAYPIPRLSTRDLKRKLITEPEVRHIIESLAKNRNNKTKTAKELGLTRGQLDYRLKMIEQMTG